MRTRYIIIIFVVFLIILYQVIQSNIHQSSQWVNHFFEYFTNDPAVFNVMNFPWTANFRKNWKQIRDEYFQHVKYNHVPLHREINNLIASCDTSDNWKTLYLRAFCADTDVSKKFPLTMNLINQVPCTTAFFSVLGPRAKLQPHVGLYKGVIRYHLGLIVPKEKEKCFLNVDGNILYWEEGSDLMFDDSFSHYVENNTDESRVILFLDIRRDFHNIFIDTINSIFLRFIRSNDVLAETIRNANQINH